MTILLFIAISFICIGCLGYLLSFKNQNIPIIITIWSFLFNLVGLAIILWLISVYNKEPQAIDVYRGNTELHVVYYDSCNFDSVVVWKPF